MAWRPPDLKMRLKWAIPRPDICVSVCQSFLRPPEPELVWTGFRYVWHQRLIAAALSYVSRRTPWEIFHDVDAANVTLVKQRRVQFYRLLPTPHRIEWLDNVSEGCWLLAHGAQRWKLNRHMLPRRMPWLMILLRSKPGTTVWTDGQFFKTPPSELML